ncbi:DEAD/DEAH box helicase [Dactylosporangium sp. NPDC000244]|uniref:DEAD/DEAH box helicase n=1 Tax=Dactylosporangium sp. NPDC000244 TaxID=3154365 RepID=UPI00331B87E9
MIVVHGLVLPDGTLACWAESPDAALHPPTTTPSHASPAPEPLPAATPSANPAPPATAPAANTPPAAAPTAAPPTAALPSSVPLAAEAPLAAAGEPSPLSPAAAPGTDRGHHGTDPANATPSTPPQDMSVTGPAEGTPSTPSTPPPDASVLGLAEGTAPSEGPAVHPFAVLPPLPGTVATADLLLPSTPHHPAPSPELAAHLPSRRRAAARRHTVWTVPIVVLSPGSDPDLLLSTVSDVAPGASIGALTDLVVFATDLADRGRFLPALTTEPAPGGGRGPAARWRPALWGADAATFDALCRAMPGVAAAATDPARHRFRLPADRPAWSPGDAARAALDTAVDHLVRARLRGGPLLGDGEARHDTAVRAWLAALTTPDARLRTATATAATNGAEAVGPGRGGFAAQARAEARAIAAAAARGLPVPKPAAEPEPEPAPEPVAGAGAVMADGPEVARLRELLERWSDSGRPAPVRTCFRLSYVEAGDDDDGLAPDPAGDDGAAGRPGPPGRFDDDGGSWLVEFLLQPAAEPGLLVPARDVWHDGASPLFKWVDYPQDVLLEDLGRASRLWPDLDEALWGPRPVSLRLDTIGAHRFLTFASLLHDAGFGVLLPAQWQRRQELGLTLSVRTRQPAAPVLRDTTTNRAAIVGFRWGLAIGDEFLSEADLAELARAKVPLVRLRGRWVHLDRERLRAGLAFLRRGGRGEMTAGEAMRLTRLVPDSDLPLPVTGVDGEGWLADLLTGRAPERLELLDPPPGLTAQLRPYQRRGVSWLAFLDAVGVGALLADDMGLGKTVQVLALEAHLRAQGPRPPTLIVCPLSVLGNWRREIERFTPHLTVRVHHGAARRAGSGPDGADLVLTTYQVATRDADTLAAVAWDRVVLDEAQHVKNAAGVTARAVRRFPARHRVALTGTPVENRLTELWSIADFLNPGLLGEASLFRARYSVPVERWGDEDAARRLRRVTRPFLLRRVKTDRAVIADLPEKFERRQWCNLTLEQATLYKAVVDELFVKLREGRAGSQRKGLVLSAMTKLKQVCNHPAHLMGDGTPLPGRSGKLARLEEILAAATQAGDRALVFTQFAKFGQLLAPHLAQRLGTGVEFLHGGTPQGSRDRMVERFQSGPGPGVLLVSLKAGGTGLNLTAANHVVHVDRWWNPATEAQATDRAFRIGQRRDVQVHTFVCIGTIEERVEEIMASKRDLAGVAVGSGEGWLTGLSTNDLLDLMSLAPEAVADV